MTIYWLILNQSIDKLLVYEHDFVTDSNLGNSQKVRGCPPSSSACYVPAYYSDP